MPKYVNQQRDGAALMLKFARIPWPPQPANTVTLDDSFWEKLIGLLAAAILASKNAKRDSDIIAAICDASYGMLGKEISGAQLFEKLKTPKTPSVSEPK